MELPKTPSFRLDGRRALVTGAGRGIGLAAAAALSEAGATVTLSARTTSEIEEVAAAIVADGGRANAITLDVTDIDVARSTITNTGPYDILVNNVGGMIPGTVDNMTEELWNTVLNTNLMSYVHTTKYAVPHLKKSSEGRILNVSGVTGKQLLPGALTTTIPNTAIIGFTKIMAAELGGDGITVNNICPGFTNTESWGPRAEKMAEVRGITSDQMRDGVSAQTLLGRWAEPKEIGDAAAFIVSAKNSYMTGTTVEVCGGFAKYI